MLKLITWDIPIDIINRNHIISISTSFTLTCVILKMSIWMSLFKNQALMRLTLSLVFDPAHWIWTRVWVSTSSRFGTKSYSVANIGFSYLQKNLLKIPTFGWKSSPGKVWTIFPLLPLTWTFSICLFSLIPYRLLGTRLKMWLLSWNVRAICLILKLIQNTRKSQGIRLRLKLGIYLSIDSKLKIETRCKSYCWIICQMLRFGLKIMNFWIFLEKISNSSPV